MEMSKNQTFEPIHHPESRVDTILALIDTALAEYEVEYGKPV